MKKKRTRWIILIIVLVVLVAVSGLVLLKCFEPKPEKDKRTVRALVGETIRVEELVSKENYKSATISPEINTMNRFSDAKVIDDGQAVYLGYTKSPFEAVVYVTDEDGEVTEERVWICPRIKD